MAIGSTIGFAGAVTNAARTVSTSTPDYPGAPITVGQVVGVGGDGYLLAIRALRGLLTEVV